MSISSSLKKLAETLQENSDQVLLEAEDNADMLSLVADVIAGSIIRLEKAAEDLKEIEPTITPQTLETIAQLASALDESDDELLRKRASLLDELLVTISTPKNAVAQAKKQTEDELKRLREKYRANMRDELYKDRFNSHNEMRQTDKIRKAVKDQVKEYRPMEGPLQTRYCPDHPGVSMTRVADSVYQCILDKKIYNYETGFTTQKGNVIPGGGVQYQVSDWGDRHPGHAVFDTRNTLMSRYAEKDGELTKQAQQDYEYGMSEGPDGKIIEVRAAPGVSEDRKVEIIREVQDVMGTLYPVVFKEASIESEFAKIANLETPKVESRWMPVFASNDRKYDVVTVKQVQDDKVHYTWSSDNKLNIISLGEFIEKFDPYDIAPLKKKA